jgi:hypothetical protein
MARKKNPPDATAAKAQLAQRLHTLRVERFGERGGPDLARRIGVHQRSWYNYEIGVTVPAEVLLRFLQLTGAEPRWLLDGEGPKYREGRPAVDVAPDVVNTKPPAVADAPASADTKVSGLVGAETLLAAVLQRLGKGSLRVTWEVESSESPGPG